MRTSKEIFAEAKELKRNVDELHIHFLGVRKWPDDSKKTQELARIAKVLLVASHKMSQLAVEIDEARRRERGEFGNDINFIN